MIFRDPRIVIQNMFGVTPKSFNAIDVILCPTTHEGFRMIHRMMFALES